MTASAITRFEANIDDTRLNDLPAATVKLMLVSSAYVPDTSPTGHALKAEVTNEIAAGNGYVAGAAPGITQARTLAPGAAQVLAAGQVPGIRIGGIINPLTGAILVTGTTPTIIQPQAIAPATGLLQLTGQPPVVAGAMLDIDIAPTATLRTTGPQLRSRTAHGKLAWRHTAGKITSRLI